MNDLEDSCDELMRRSDLIEQLQAQLESARGILTRLVEWNNHNNRSSVDALVARDLIVADARAFLEKATSASAEARTTAEDTERSPRPDTAAEGL